MCRICRYRGLQSTEIFLHDLLEVDISTLSFLLLFTLLPPFFSPARINFYTMVRERERPGLTHLLVWSLLHHLSGHGKEIDRVPMSSYRKVEPKATVRKVSNYQPPPLTRSLPRRSGCITPPLMEPTDFDQIQSPLFNLPAGVLLLIYEQVIGKNIIHIVRRSQTLSHATCKTETPGDQDECRAMKCRGTKLPNGVCVPDKKSHDNFISLLQTCRKMFVLLPLC